MTGDDADILCGEWDSNGNIDVATSGEAYNIALTIKEIVRHPDYIVNPDTEQSYLENDIALLELDEELDLKVYTPVCLARAGLNEAGMTMLSLKLSLKDVLIQE